MAVFRTGKPNVNALARRGDADALVAAAGFQDLVSAGGDGRVDRGASIRKEAILALGRLGPECGSVAVQAALFDPADEVRTAAIRVLFAREDAGALAASLAAFPPAEHGESRTLAIMALLDLCQPECAAALAAALLHAPGDDPVAEDGAALLRLLVEADAGSDVVSEVVAVLLEALRDERDAVAARAEELLVLLAPFGTEVLISELNAGAVPHRAAAVLSEIKDTRALKPLMDGLLHRDPRVRAECAGALGELRDPAAVEPLFHATRDSDDRVRAHARFALDQLGMVALVVGASALVRPMILEAVPGLESGSARIEAQSDLPRDGEARGDHSAEAISREWLGQLLAGMDDMLGDPT
jgi:HEAT repeat protein